MLLEKCSLGCKRTLPPKRTFSKEIWIWSVTRSTQVHFLDIITAVAFRKTSHTKVHKINWTFDLFKEFLSESLINHSIDKGAKRGIGHQQKVGKDVEDQAVVRFFVAR